MIMNKLVNPVFRNLAGPQFFFSTKKKNMELTLRAPYRTPHLTQAPSSKISPISADSQREISDQLLSFRTDALQLSTSSPQDSSV